MTEERRIEFTGTGFQSLGWGLLACLLSLLIIPAAWGAVVLYRWFLQNLSFSDGTVASFEGRGGQVWGYFVIGTLLGLAPQLSRLIKDPTDALLVLIVLPILLLPISAAIWLRIMRWFFSSIKLSCGTNLNFKGNYGPYMGWLLLVTLSGFTIIGWAWALVAMLRWVCRNIDAGQNQLEFLGSGWGLLWRCLVAGLLSIIIIPIPWVWLWVIRWFTGNMLIKRETVLMQDTGSSAESPLPAAIPPIITDTTMMLASQGQRLGTLLLDMIFFFVFTLIIGFLLVLIGLEDLVQNMNRYSLCIVLFIYYYVPQEALSGRTLGKLITGTKVVKKDGNELSFVQALGRTLCRFIPFEAFSFFGGHGRPRGWHDKIFKTKVISVRRTGAFAETKNNLEMTEDQHSVQNSTGKTFSIAVLNTAQDVQPAQAFSSGNAPVKQDESSCISHHTTRTPPSTKAYIIIVAVMGALIAILYVTAPLVWRAIRSVGYISISVPEIMGFFREHALIRWMVMIPLFMAGSVFLKAGQGLIAKFIGIALLIMFALVFFSIWTIR